MVNRAPMLLSDNRRSAVGEAINFQSSFGKGTSPPSEGYA
jgi:hypothetical protein